MSNRPHSGPHPAYELNHRRRPRSTAVWLVGLGVVALGLALGLALTLRGGGRTGLRPTGEITSMGMPVMTTAGTTSGEAAAGGVVVTGAQWDLGEVPVNVAVRPAWTLRNDSDVTVTIGEPRAEVREGCCPGPFRVQESTLPPGASTLLTFELSMHPGMDGPHDLGVHVPVTSPSGVEDLTLGVVATFG